jgi:hypothetical protein
MSSSGGAMRMLPRPVTFVTGNAKKLEEVRAILGQSIPFQSLKLDRKMKLILSSIMILSYKTPRAPFEFRVHFIFYSLICSARIARRARGNI